MTLWYGESGTGFTYFSLEHIYFSTRIKNFNIVFSLRLFPKNSFIAGEVWLVGIVLLSLTIDLLVR